VIALLASVAAETDLLKSAIEASGTVTIGSTALVEGTLKGRRVVLCAGGMGKANAAHAATVLLTRFAPKAILVFGIGGAYPSSGAKIGDLVLAHEEIAGDEGVLTSEGFRDTEFMGIPLIKTGTATIFNRYPAPKPLLDLAIGALRSRELFEPVHVGPFVTLSTCTGTASRAQELEQRYHCLCENMEGAAVAHVAELHGTAWLEVRGISNIVEDRNLSTWDIPEAAKNAQQAVIRIVEAWTP